MKKYLSIALVSLLFVVPAVSHAQVATTTDAHQEYIQELKTLIGLLKEELQLILAAQQTQATSTTVTTQPVQVTATTTVDTGTVAPVEPQLSCSFNTVENGTTRVGFGYSFPSGATGVLTGTNIVTDSNGIPVVNITTGSGINSDGSLVNNSELPNNSIIQKQNINEGTLQINVSEAGFQSGVCTAII